MKTLIGIFRSILCWGPCPCIKYSYSTRIIYTVILIIQIIFLLLIKLEIIPTYFLCGEKEPEYCNINKVYYAIYLSGGGILCIFLFFGLIQIRVKSSRDLRSFWHNGFWLLKILIFIFSDFFSLDNFIVHFVFYIDLYFGYICTFIMIVLEFVMLWKTAYAISIHLLKRFIDGSIHSGAILVFIGVTTYSIPIFFAIMSLTLFDENTTNNEIYWATLFISYSFGLIYLGHNLLKQRKSRLLLGGTLASHVVFTMTLAMFHDSFNLYKRYFYIKSIYYMLHSIEIAVAFASVAYFIVYGLKVKQPDLENAIVTVEEKEKQICCCIQRKVVEVRRPEGVQEIERGDGFLEFYATTDKNDDEYTRVRYSWSNFYFILGVFYMFMAAAMTNWYYLDFSGKSKDVLVFQNPNVKWVKFISAWFCMLLFILFAIKTKYWEYDETTVHKKKTMDIEQFRQRGKDMVDFICNYYETLPSRRVYPDVEPGFMATLFPPEPPKKSEKWDSIVNDVKEIIIPGLTHWQHPHFHAYFANGSCSASILASFLIDSLACLGFSWASCPSATELEEIMCDWLARALGLPNHFLFHSPESNGGGVIQTSASECILFCILAARTAAIQYLKDQNPEVEIDDAAYLSKLVAYTSTEAHSCVEKAAKMAMVKLRALEPDEECSLRGPTLAEAIEEDIRSGLHPFFVSCTLGTTASAGFDNLKEIGPICVKFPALWLHVDAAYAGNGFICPELRYLKEGLEFAESFNTNANKWLLVGFDCSLLWVKDRYKLTSAFMVDPLYLRYDQMNEAIDFRHWGVALSRKFRSLKLFFVFRDLGVEGLQSKIRNDIKMAKEFESLILKDSRFEVCNIVRTGLVCFRLNAADEINEDLIGSINKEGRLHLTPSRIKDKFVLRFCVIHPYSDVNLMRNAWSIIQEHATNVLALGDSPSRRVSGESTRTHNAETRRFSFVLPVPQDVYDEQSSKKTLKDDTMPVLVVDETAMNSDGGLNTLSKMDGKQHDSHNYQL